MILSNPQRDSIVEGIENTTKMNISPDVMAHIVKVMTEYSYKDKIGSIVREGISNSIDSHTEANVLDPIIIRLSKTGNNYSLEFIDVGLGLDKESFDKYIMGIGQSSKKSNPHLLGGFGSGAKAPLSYTDNYSYICRKDGIERSFIIFKGKELPESTMVYEKPTEERNGVTVKIPINYYDVSQVITKIKQQCSYFENVYFDIPNMDNSYTIYKNDLFTFNTLGAFSRMHISLKNVSYPLDFNQLGIDPIDIPIAIRFDNYDSIKPIFTREDIEYTSESIQAIKDKIKELSEWFCNEYNSQTKEYESLLKAWKFINDNDKFVKVGDKSFEITELEQYSSVKCKELSIKGISILPPKKYRRMFDELTRDFTASGYIYNSRMKTAKHFNDYILGKKTVVINHNLTGFFREYLKEEGYKYILRDGYATKENLKWYKAHILDDIPKEKWRDTIKEYQSVKKEFIGQSIIDGRKLHLSEDFLEFVKENKKTRSYSSNYVSKSLNKQKGDITIDWAIPKEVGNGYKLLKKKHAIKDLGKLRHLSIICENKEQAIDLRSSYTHVCTVNNRDIKHINHHNFIMLAQIKKAPEKVKLVKKHLTAMLFEKELEIFDKIWSGSTKEILQVLKPLEDNRNTLKTYVRQNLQYVKDSVIIQELIKEAEEKQEFDMSLWKEYKEIKKANETFNFMRFYTKPQEWRQEELMDYTKFINEQLLVRKLSGKFPELECFELCVKQIETILENELQLESTIL